MSNSDKCTIFTDSLRLGTIKCQEFKFLVKHGKLPAPSVKMMLGSCWCKSCAADVMCSLLL